jgi:hypothetical protein
MAENFLEGLVETKFQGALKTITDDSGAYLRYCFKSVMRARNKSHD